VKASLSCSATGLLEALLEQGFHLPCARCTVNGQTLLLDATPITNAGALLTLYQPNRIGERCRRCTTTTPKASMRCSANRRRSAPSRPARCGWRPSMHRC
jgi:transcriptional regulator of aromatic amino acid metabolism